MDRKSISLPRLLLAVLLTGAVGSAAAAVTRVGTASFVDSTPAGGNAFSTSDFVSTLYASADTYLAGGAPDQNESSNAFLRVQQTGPDRSLLTFDSTELSDAANGRPVLRATLRLYIETNGDDWNGGSGTLDTHRVTASWTEAGATWNCPIDTNTANSAPDCATQWAGGTYDSTATDSALITNSQSGWVEWDVTADVAAFLASTATNYGWIVKKTDEGVSGQVDFTSREGTNKPELSLVFGN
jgi:hypothetical protein